MTPKTKVNRHSDAHSIDVNYLLELKNMYEVKLLNWLSLEADLVSMIALLECKLFLYKGDKLSPQYLDNRNLISTLVKISDSVGQFMLQYEKSKYKIKDLRMENANLKQRNQLLEQELLTLRKYSNL